MPPEERLNAILSGDDRLSDDITQIAEELADAADDAIDAALGLERTEDAADDLARSLDDVSDEIDEVATSAAVATASVSGLDAALSGLETDIDLDLDAADLDALTLDAEDLSTAVSAVPAEARLAQSALSELAEEDLQFDADVDVDVEDITRRVALSVDRSGLQQAFDSIDDDEVDVHPVLRDLRGTLADFDADEATARAAVTTETTDLDAPFSAAVTAVDALSEEVDDLETSLVSVYRAAADLPERVSVDIQGDISDILDDLRTTEARVRSLDGRTISIDVDREDLALPDADELDLSAAVAAPDTRRSALGLGTVSIPVDLDLRQRVDDLTDRLDLSAITAQTDAVERKATMDISLGDSERDVLSSLAEIHAALASLPDDDRVSIHTESDLDALVATLTGLDSIPDEVRSEIDVDALTGEAQTALTAVLGTAERVDDLDPTVDVDTDTSAMRTLRGLDGSGLDFDVPDLDMPDLGDRDGQGGVLSGATEVLSGGLRAAPGGRGIARAFAGMSPAAMLGGAGVLGGLGSAVAGAVSAGIGAALGAGAIGAGLSLAVTANVDEGEVEALRQQVEAALAPLEGGAWEDFQQRVFAGVPQAAGMTAQALNSVQDTLLDTADRVGDSFWTEFPSILAETTDSVQMLDDDISSIAIGALESIPGIIRESTRAADELLPEFGDLAAPTLDIAGSLSRLGTGALDLGINALLEPALDTLAALAPLADLFGDALHIAGEAAAFVYDHLGSENVDAFAGAIQTAVDVAYAFGTALYNVGDAFGVWDRLASIILAVGDGLGFVYDAASDAYDTLAGGAEWVLEKILTLHNVLNNVPGAAEMSAFISAEDIAMPDLGGAPGGSDSDGDSEEFGGSGFTPSAAPTAAPMASAVASLPSTTATPGASSASATPSSGSAPAPSPAAGTRAATGAASGGTTIHNNITVEGGMPRSDARLNRMIRKMHQKLNRQQRKRSTAGAR
jgi:hypothetical protein